MVHISVLLAFAASVSALPLNINLGAYSPALVVGDGEISFGGKQDVTNLMNALEGAAVSGAAANAAGAPAAAAPAAAATSPTAAQVAPAAGAPATNAADQTPQITALQGMGKEIAPRVVPLQKDAAKLASRDLAGFDRALTYAAAALKSGPEVQLGTGEGGSGVGITVKAGGTTSTTGTTPKAGNATKTRRDAFEYDAEGNEIEKRDFEYDAEGNEIEARSFEYDAEGNEIEKRSFEYDAEGNEIEKRSFEYDAEGNEIEKRSTGEAFYYDASSGTAEKKAKRASFEYDAEGNEIENRNLAGKTKTTVTTMYIREGITGASNEGVEKRSVQKRSSRMQRRAPVDGVNLNVAGREGVTLTIVETRSADDKE